MMSLAWPLFRVTEQALNDVGGLPGRKPAAATKIKLMALRSPRCARH